MKFSQCKAVGSTLCWLEIFKGSCRALFNKSTDSELAFLCYLVEVDLEIMAVLELKADSLCIRHNSWWEAVYIRINVQTFTQKVSSKHYLAPPFSWSQSKLCFWWQ